jgi:hypothetical protein
MLDDKFPGNMTTIEAVVRTTKRTQDIQEEFLFFFQSYDLSWVVTFYIIKEESQAKCAIDKYGLCM